ncbi:glycosyltransferase [Acidithiobacillus thiooxidans]|uniref:glycosyltransferase n=1 Tax=Acidithiobacillus thiooxidans TaxID=930 RepID=UPI0028652566|nr:glycosyltransferase [Acidithiobacillus thiooxidans]MDR7926176.1 glycosyltransferase [Acidithiobacillus thiooxidans]
MIEKKTNVLIVTPDIHGPIRNGGIGTAFMALSQFLSKSGYNVTILYALGNHTESEPIEYWIRSYKEFNITLIPLDDEIFPYRLDAPSYRALAWKVDRWMRIHSENYSIAIFPEWMGLAYYALLAKGQGLAYRNLQFIVNIHSPESWAREGGRTLPNHLDDIDRDFMERESVARADITVSPSQYLFNWMEQNNWDISNKKVVIPNLMPVDFNRPHQKNSIHTEPINQLVFFGRLEVRKGLKVFLDAFNLVKPEFQSSVSQIVFLGKPINNETFSSIEFIKNRTKNWKPIIQIITDKNRDEALEFLSDSGKLCIISSLVENSPYTVLECLEKQINFCASNVGGIPELIHEEDHAHTLFAPTPASLAHIIENKLQETFSPAKVAQTQVCIAQKWEQLIGSVITQNVDSNFIASTLDDQPNPLVSICLTHFERPLLLSRALESIRKQTYPNIEVVLVDDGSTSVAAIELLDKLSFEFSSLGWQLLRQKNQYLGAARNNAAVHARGEFLIFMDDDNVAMPHEIEIFVNAIQSSKADILTCAVAPFVGNTIPDTPTDVWLPLGGSAGAGLFSNAFGDANACWRTCVFHSLGGFTEDYGVGHEDWELFADAVLSGYRLELVPEVLFWYRVNANGMLRAGDPWADHARSVRPYLRHNPGGLGSATAYAVYLRQKSRLSDHLIGKSPSFSRKLKIIARHTVNPLMWIKLGASYKQLGLKRTLNRIKLFVRERA